MRTLRTLSRFVGTAILSVACLGATKLEKKIANDQTKLADAQSASQTAEKNLNAAVTAKQNEFDNSPDLKTAMQATVDASKEVQAARDKVLDSLKKTANYQALADKEQTAEKTVDTLKTANPSSPDLSAASADVLRLSGEMGKIEQAALDQDPDWKAATAKQSAAAKVVSDMRAAFNTTMMNDPKLAKLRKAKQDAETKVTEASNRLNSDESLKK